MLAGDYVSGCALSKEGCVGPYFSIIFGFILEIKWLCLLCHFFGIAKDVLFFRFGIDDLKQSLDRNLFFAS